MEKFTKVKSIIAPLKLDNIDTDMLIPKQFLKTIKRTGLGKNLFHEFRYDLDGNLIEDFILNKEPFNKSKILLAGSNFGCGSSREHAPWALLDFGIRVVLASSYADIFFNNCFKNSILPIILPKETIADLHNRAEKGNIEAEIDLEKQIIKISDQEISFEIDSFRKNNLLEGIDDIGLTLKSESDISKFEEKDKVRQPWLYENSSL